MFWNTDGKNPCDTFMKQSSFESSGLEKIDLAPGVFHDVIEQPHIAGETTIEMIAFGFIDRRERFSMNGAAPKIGKFPVGNISDTVCVFTMTIVTAKEDISTCINDSMKRRKPALPRDADFFHSADDNHSPVGIRQMMYLFGDLGRKLRIDLVTALT